MNLIQGDALDLPVRDESVDCIVTSWPYFGMREYGESDQEMGRGSLAIYLEEIEDFLAEAYRTLTDGGSCWLVVGDTRAGSGGAGGDWRKGKRAGQTWRQGDTGLADGNLCLIPQAAAQVAQRLGFVVRSWITWDKGKTRPESASHARRPLTQTETVLFLTKGRLRTWRGGQKTSDVWRIPPYHGKSAHLAPFPLELASRCIYLSTTSKDLVFDPFVGSGTTVAAAQCLGRRAVGLDLYPWAEE